MSNFKLLGCVSWFCALILIGFQAIGRIMESKMNFTGLTLMTSMEGNLQEWVEGISINFVKTGILFVLNTPLYILLLVLGGFCFFMNAVFRRG